MDNARIDDLKRRLQKDPSSIAFAQLGEEYRRAGRSREAIETCRAGLTRHPGYLSARVTLGRALLDLGELDLAERELEEVLRVAPDNIAALRAVAEAAHRRGERRTALAHYQAALALAPRDVELQNMVAMLLEETRRGPVRAQTAATPAVVPPTPPGVPAVHQVSAGLADAPAKATPRAWSATAERGAERAIPILQRWLDAIVADRERQAATS